MIPSKYYDVGDLAKILKKAKSEGSFKSGNTSEANSALLPKSGKVGDLEL